jgi:hypothetical protein
VLHNRALTADVMQKKNWPCESLCSLYFCIQETDDHLLCKCNYTEALWRAVSGDLQLPQYDTMFHLGGPVDWVILLSASRNKALKSKMLGK